MNFPWRPRCLGSYFADDFLGIDWGFVAHGSCFLNSFLYSSLKLVPCSCLCSSELEYYSSIEGRLMSCTVGCFALEGKGCSIEGVVAEGRRLQSFCFLRTHFGVELWTKH